MPVYEYQGLHYDLETTDPAEAKAKILNHLGVQTEAKAAPFSFSDLALQGAQSVVGAAKSTLEGFGAGNAPAQYLEGVTKDIGSYISPERKAEIQRRAALEKQAAASGKTLEELSASLGAVTEAPATSIVQGIGSSIPTVALGLGVGALGAAVGAPVAIAAAVGIGTKFLIGALQGAGEVKGDIYSNVKAGLEAKGVKPEEADKQAKAAQDYLGENFGNIAAATGIGALAGGTGVESKLMDMFGKPIAKKVAEKAVEKAAPGFARRTTTEFAKEASTEGLQAGQGQYAQNVAMTRAGMETPEMQGVLGAAARDALIGGLTGSAVSVASGKPKEAPKVDNLNKPAGTKAGQEALDILNAPLPETPPAPPPVQEREVNVQPPINTAVGTSDAVVREPGAEPAAGAVTPDRAGVEGNMPAPVPLVPRAEEQPAALKYENPDIQNVYDAYANYKGKTSRGSPELAEFKISRLTDLANTQNQPINVWLHQGEIVPLVAGVEKPKYARLIGTINPTVEAAPEAPAAPAEPTPPQAPAAPKVSGIGDYSVGLPAELNDTFERLQNRNRASQQSIAQMKNVSSKTDYDRLSVDPNFGSGAPVVISDFKLPDTHLGNTDVATAVDGRKIPVQYAVVSAENLLPSHTSDGQVNKQYADTSIPAIRPVAGNGRVAGLQEGYMKDSPSITDYATKMIGDTRHGIDPEAIKNTPNPILVRLMPKENITKDIGDVSNVPVSMPLSPLERAKNDANRLDLNNIEFEETKDGALNLSKKSASQFIQSMPENERNELVNNKTGEPNAASIDRLRNAIFLKTYGSDTLGELYTESFDPEAKLILAAMQIAAPNMSRLEGQGMYDIRNNVVQAAELAVNARKNGIPLKEIASQTDITSDPTTSAVLQMFADNSRSGKRMGSLLNQFANTAYEQNVEDMFGTKPERPLSEVAESLKPQEEEYMLREATPEQMNSADIHAKEVGGDVVYQKGDIALVRGFSVLSGQPIYSVAKGDMRSRTDIESYTGKLVTDKEKQELIAEKNKIEEEDAKKHKENPFIKFDKNGLSFSKGVPTQVGKVLAGWKGLLKLAPNIHITTVEDARNNRNNYTGEHRVIGSVGLDYKERGVMRQLPSGDYYVAFTKSSSITKMLETLAHELGHVHQKEVFDKASPEVKKEITSEYQKWLQTMGDKTARELVNSLRAKTTAKTTKVPDDLTAKQLTSYWKSFSEWYADQTSKWATTSEKPVGVVEKYFKRLGEALRSFYGKVRNSGYLPNETFKKYLDTVTKEDIAEHPIVSKPEDQMALFMKSEVEEPKKVETATTTKGQEALDITSALGRVTKDPDPSYVKKVTEAWNNAKDNPKATVQDAKAAVVNWNDRVQTWAFSSDAAINNSIRREIQESGKSNEEMIGTLLSISQSQVVHGDAMANGFLSYGNLKYDKDLYKYEIVEDKANLPELAKQIGEIKDKYGLTLAQAELIGHTAFEAKRLKSLLEFNNKVAEEVRTMRAEADKLAASGKAVAANALREKASRRAKDDKFIHMTSAEIEAGNRLFSVIPELKGVVETWNDMRKNASKVLVDSGLWNEEEADFLLSNADYVPFFREEQLEQGKGPKEYIRGLMVEAQEKKLKGSNKPVNDIFDNMSRWLQYSVNRAVRNKSALSLIDAASEFGQARQVESRAGNSNVVRVWRNGKEEFHEMSDPMFVEAFTGLESIAIPSWKTAMQVANTLRQSIVLNPIFSAAQVPQDAFAAMFTSGLKPQYALQIPVRAVKEFLFTLAHKSATNNELKKYGVVGVRDFTSQMARLDAQTFAGLKGDPTLWGKVKSSLEHVAMASDNAVRQATYEAAMKQGLSKAEALEKSFEIWNIRRKGTSKTLAMSSQLIPFFSAYLTAQNVAIKTISGVGTSPTERMAALGVLASTTASVMTLSLLYSMAVGDDDGYNKKSAAVRDRMFVIPGTNGLGIPLRSDIFSIPKILGEHMYLLMTNKGFEDGRKFRDSMTNALMNSITSPTVVPQLIKPVVEITANHNFFQNRPLIGEYQKRMEKERQFNDSTSEIAKLLGKTGYVSPINADHLIRGWFGSVGGLAIYMTNPLLHSDPNVTKPTMSTHEMLAELPGTSAFMSKEKESGLKNDFYVLRDEVAKVANTLADLRQRNPEKIPEYAQREGVREKAGMSAGIQALNKQIADMDKMISRTSNLPDSQMSPDQKSERIKQIREAQEQLLKNVNVTKLREMAKI